MRLRSPNSYAICTLPPSKADNVPVKCERRITDALTRRNLFFVFVLACQITSGYTQPSDSIPQIDLVDIIIRELKINIKEKIDNRSFWRGNSEKNRNDQARHNKKSKKVKRVSTLDEPSRNNKTTTYRYEKAEG